MKVESIDVILRMKTDVRHRMKVPLRNLLGTSCMFLYIHVYAIHVQGEDKT